MPGPIDFLTEPLIPRSAIAGAQDYLDTPSIDRSPMMARLGGFGAGALEGLRQQTDPLSLLSLIPAVKLGRGMTQGVRGLRALSAADDLPVGGKGTPTLGERIPEFTPVGEEDLINALRGPQGSAYKRLLEAGGR